MKIRKATEKDFEKFYEIYKEGKKHFEKISQEKFPTSKRDEKRKFLKTLENKEKFVFLIESEKNIIGYLEACIWKNKKIPTSYIEDMVIKKEYRKKGFGKKAIKWFIDKSKKEGVKRIGLGTRAENLPAIELYKKLGFKIIGYNLGMELK